MIDMEERARRAIEEIVGNEALLEMLETDAAADLLDWGKTTAAAVVKQTEGMDDDAAEQATAPRLKAVRQTMRSLGNWAAGKYADSASRVQLRDKLLAYLLAIFGEEVNIPSADQLDALLNEVDDQQNTPHQLILKWREVLNEFNLGAANNDPQA